MKDYKFNELFTNQLVNKTYQVTEDAFWQYYMSTWRKELDQLLQSIEWQKQMVKDADALIDKNVARRYDLWVIEGKAIHLGHDPVTDYEKITVEDTINDLNNWSDELMILETIETKRDDLIRRFKYVYNSMRWHYVSQYIEPHINMILELEPNIKESLHDEYRKN